MDIIVGSDLASYPGIDATLTTQQLNWIATQASELVLSAWACATDPAPAWAKMIALNAAGRFAQNPLGLESYTTSVDDGSETRRHRNNAAGRVGIYLTDDERASLACSPTPLVGTIWTNPARPPRNPWGCW